jgi:heterotetrameric sarcosine oxidase gamma subunit
MAGRSAGTWWCPVTPARLLVLSEPGHGPAVGAAIREAAEAEDTNVSVIDVTSGLAALALLGPDAGELLARFCAIDVRPDVTPVAGFRPGSVARTPGYVLKEAEGRLLVIFGWAFGEYLWEVVADAAQHLGGGPIGADGLPALAHTEEPARA